MHVTCIDDVNFYRGNRQVPDLLTRVFDCVCTRPQKTKKIFVATRLWSNRGVQSTDPRFCMPWQPSFEAFAVTRNATSIDGTHYYQEPNILLAQLVLNALDTSHGQLLSVSLNENGKPSV